METENKFIRVPAYSLTPSRLSLYNSLTKVGPDLENQKASLSRVEKEKILANLHGGEYTAETRWHKFAISNSGKKTLMLKINWLYFLAKSRYKKSVSGKEIFNFKMNFITLTLSGKQMHPTSEITKICFNQFLTEIRERYKMDNYVWRLEFQKNGNVHYHIVTDCFTDFHIVTKIWNRCQSKLGYTKQYYDKHSKMSLNDYVAAYSNNGAVPFDTLKYRFARGKASNWAIPNSCDVKSVSSGKKIQFYISKYFAKKENANNPNNPLDTKENSLGLRMWFCSRSLSKLDKISGFVEPAKFDLLNIVTSVKDTFEVIHEYCTSYFFNFSSLLNDGKAIIHQILYNYAKTQKYIPDI